MNHWNQFPGESRSYDGTWEKLSQVAISGAEYDSRERQPHPKCLEGTREDLLNYIHGLLANKEKGRLIWLHGTAGVGKSAVAFTVAERMRDLKVTERTNTEKRLAGTFFFSRKHTERCTTGRFFATLAYQLASNFPSVREDLNKAIRDNPALLDPDKSLRAQMEGLFLIPLRRLQFRLHGCQPSVFVVDALDECTSKTEVADLISLLGQALREPDLPVIHILLTSRSEDHIREAIQEGDVRPLVWEIPVKTTGEGVAAIISLDGADVDNDIFTFLEYSFRKLRGRCSDFPQPTTGELARLASRAGRRFIVASTMMKFIDDGYHDPRDRLQLMLDFTSDLLPGTEVYKLYDRILATCTDPARAYLHLSVVAALADPLPIRQISELLGPGEGKDVGAALAQLRSVMDIPIDHRLPVNIYHSSVRDYVSDSSNCSLPDVQHIRHPHSLLAHSSFHLMMQDIPESMVLRHALFVLKRQRRAMKMKSHNPKSLQQSLAFIVEPPTPHTVLTALQWLWGGHRSELLPWLETLDGRAWLETQRGKDWLRTQWRTRWRINCLWRNRRAETWQNFWQSQTAPFTLQLSGRGWLQTENAGDWLKTQSGRGWLQTESGGDWLQTENAGDWLKTQSGRDWLQTQDGRDWLQIQDGRDWLPPQSRRQWLQTQRGQDWMKTQRGQDWLQSRRGRDWLKTQSGREWLQIESGKDWLHTPHGQEWQSTAAASVWVTMEEFLSTWEAVSNFVIVPELFSLPAFRVIQQFKTLPDFLMFPMFLAFRHQDQDHVLHDSPLSNRVIYCLEYYAREAQQRSRSTSGALDYACQNWAFHLLRAPNPRDNTLNHMFISFWSLHLLSWLERQWYLKGLRSCLAILSEGQKFVLSEGQQAHHQSRRNQSKLSLFLARWSGTSRD